MGIRGHFRVLTGQKGNYRHCDEQGNDRVE